MAQKPRITSLNGFYQLIWLKKAKLKVIFWYILAARENATGTGITR